MTDVTSVDFALYNIYLILFKLTNLFTNFNRDSDVHNGAKNTEDLVNTVYQLLCSPATKYIQYIPSKILIILDQIHHVY